MNATVAVFTRELRERSRIFLVAAALILIPYIAAIFPFVRGQRADAVAMLGGATAAVYGLAVALVLGVSTIGRELTDKRLSFYFSKPLSPVALWGGKALAALVSIFGVMAIIAVPTMVLKPDVWSSPRDTLLLPAVLFLSVALFLVSHAVATMVRSRSGIIAVDLACAAAVALVAYLLARQLLAGGAYRAAVLLAEIAAGAFIAILAVAPLYQLAHGRTDVRRSHVALSKFVWCGMAVVLVLAAMIVGWIATAPLSSIRQTRAIDQTPSGDWVLVSGQSRRAGYFVSALIETSTGERQSTRMAPWWGQLISRDGSTLATMELADLAPRSMELDKLVPGSMRRSVRVGPIADRDETIIIEPPGSLVKSALSDDGSRLALATPSAISVYDTSDGRMALSARFDGEDVMQMYFSSPTIVRLHTFHAAGEGIHELDLSRRTITKSGELPTKNSWNSASADGSRIYLRHNARIADGGTGDGIAKIPVQPLNFFAGAMMNDGRTAVIAIDGMHVYDRDGRELKTIKLPPIEKVGIRAQIGESKLIVGGETRTIVVDVDKGTAGPIIENVHGPYPQWGALILPRFSENATIVVRDDKAQLLLWDLRTNQRRPLPL